MDNLASVDTVKLGADLVHRLVMDRIRKTAEMAILDNLD